MAINKNYLIKLVLSLIYCMIIGQGLYGWNSDFYSYKNSPNTYWQPLELIGGYISTASIEGVFLGPYLVAFILSMSVFSVIGVYVSTLPSNYRRKAYVIFLWFCFMHTWPIITATTNAFRQGVALAFIYFFIAALMQEKKIASLRNSVIAALSHKMGLFFFPINSVVLFYTSTNKKNFGRFSNLTYYILPICIMILYVIAIGYTGILHQDTYSTGLDLSLPLGIYFLFYIILVLVAGVKVKKSLIIFRLLLVASILVSSLFVLQSLVFERLIWAVILLSILDSIRIIFIKYRVFNIVSYIVFLSLSAVSFVYFVLNQNDFSIY